MKKGCFSAVLFVGEEVRGQLGSVLADRAGRLRAVERSWVEVLGQRGHAQRVLEERGELT